MKFQKSSFLGPDFKQVVEYFLKKCSQEEIAQFAGLARCLWLRHNEVVHGGVWSSPQSLVQAITLAFEDFQMAKEMREPSSAVGMGCNLGHWTAPPFGWMKVN